MRRFFTLIFSMLLIASNLTCAPELRSYEYLSENLWTDHVKHTKKLLDLMQDVSFLELGVGEGTKFYLDNCKEVTSLELIDAKNGGPNEDYYNQCLELYSTYPNWHPILYRCTKAIDDAVQVALEQNINPLSVNTAYQYEIESICDNIFKNKNFDIVLVDPGVLVRGSFVNELFGRVDVIVAHDVSNHPKIYGWEWVNTPPDYERICFLEGSGTAFWIKKTRLDLIDALKQYPHTP